MFCNCESCKKSSRKLESNEKRYLLEKMNYFKFTLDFLYVPRKG